MVTKKIIILSFIAMGCGTSYDKVQGIRGKQGEKGEQGERGDKGEKGDKGDNGKDGLNSSTNPIPQPTNSPNPTSVPTPPMPSDTYGYPQPICQPTQPCAGSTNNNTVIVNGTAYPSPPTGHPPQDTILVCACVPYACGSNPCLYQTLRIRAKDVNSYNIGYRGACL